MVNFKITQYFEAHFSTSYIVLKFTVNITQINVTFFGYVKDADRIKFRAFYFLNAKNIILVCVVIFNSKAAKFYSDKKKFVVNKFLG